jgi:hypothetical protein
LEFFKALRENIRLSKANKMKAPNENRTEGQEATSPIDAIPAETIAIEAAVIEALNTA